jgi:phosphate transport system protein
VVSGTVKTRLDGLEAELLQVGRQVQAQLGRALEALAGGDLALAEEVAADDDAIDRAYIEVEQEILRTLALHAPIARDLRLVAAILHINTHLERMGDLCVNIAKFTRFVIDHPPIPEIQATLAEMGTHAQKLIAAAMTCFARRDAELAASLPQLDEPLDRLNQDIFRQIERAAEEDRPLEWASRMVLVARFLERLGDHSVDIGEQVGFIVTGEVREFPPPKSARGRPDRRGRAVGG